MFKINGNDDLCYNHSTISEEVKLGIARCDKHGMPVLPPPAATNEPPSSVDDIGSGGGEDHGEGGDGDDKVEKKNQVRVDRGPSKVVLGVAIGLSAVVFLIIFLVLLFKC